MKEAIKKFLPKTALRWRARKLMASGIEPDLELLANIKQHLPEVHGGEEFVKYFSKDKAAIDVGACGGEYSCVMAEMFEKVLSIEPTGDMASHLRKALPCNCEVVESALGAEPGTVSIRVPKIGGVRMNALSTVTSHNFEFSDIGAVDVDEVKQATIDQLVSERSFKPSFIKIDVEGYEGNVLAGAREVIRIGRPVVMIEIEKRHNKNYSEIFSMLGSYGYAPFHFRNGRLSVSSPAIVEESFDFLKGVGVSGMQEMIAAKASEKYLNNFIFLPLSPYRMQ